VSRWIIAGTAASEPYPCRCHEARFGRCSAAFCPCAGRTDPQNAACCAWRFSPADHVMAMAAWQLKRHAEDLS
jgi:hypothetical protein